MEKNKQEGGERCEAMMKEGQWSRSSERGSQSAAPGLLLLLAAGEEGTDSSSRGSTLPAAVPSCVIGRPSLGTGASLGALTPLGPPGRECATDEIFKGPGRAPWPPAPATALLFHLSGCPCLQHGVSSLSKPFSRSARPNTPLPPDPYWPHQVLEDSFREMTIYASMTAPLERKGRKAQTITYLKRARSYRDAKATEPSLLSRSLCSLSWPWPAVVQPSLGLPAHVCNHKWQHSRFLATRLRPYRHPASLYPLVGRKSRWRNDSHSIPK